MVRGLIVGFACFAPKCYFIFGEDLDKNTGEKNIECIKKGFKGIKCKSSDVEMCDRLFTAQELSAYGFTVQRVEHEEPETGEVKVEYSVFNPHFPQGSNVPEPFIKSKKPQCDNTDHRLTMLKLRMFVETVHKSLGLY